MFFRTYLEKKPTLGRRDSRGRVLLRELRERPGPARAAVRPGCRYDFRGRFVKDLKSLRGLCTAVSRPVLQINTYLVEICPRPTSVAQVLQLLKGEDVI